MSSTMQDIQQGPFERAKRWSLAASMSSVVSALIASACCVGPLVFALLGIGGAGLLMRFEPYRSFFTALTFGLLGAGFYFTYRRPKTAMPGTTRDPQCACPAPKTNRAGKIVLW